MSKITESISIVMPNGQPSCRNNLIAKYLKSRRIPCCIVAVNDIKTAIPVLFENEIDIILSYRPDIDSPFAHFSVVTGFDKTHVFVNDPQKDPPTGTNYPISMDELQKQMEPHLGSSWNEITRPNTVILMSDPKKCAEMSFILDDIQVFSCVQPMLASVLVPDDYDAHWYDVPRDPAPPPPFSSGS